VFLPAVLSGVLLWTAFFPLDLGPVAFVALAPFLTLVRAENVTARRRYSAAFVGGLVFFALALNWVRVAHPLMALYAWPGLTIYCALYWPLALVLLRKLDRLNLPLAATLPVVWVGLEYVRAHFPTGFPFLSAVGAHQPVGFGWYALGYALHDVLPLVQAADLGGVYLVSAAVAAVDGAAYEWLARSAVARQLLRWPPPPDRRGCTREMVVTAAAVAVPVVLACYGLMQMTHKPFAAGPRVAALQGNLSQSEKNVASDPKASEARVVPLYKEYDPLAIRAGREQPDLVIWPETCWPDPWFDAPPGVPDDPEATLDPTRPPFRRQLALWQRRLGGEAVALTKTNSLVGLNGQVWDGREWHKYNSAVLIHKDGTDGGRYDKIHLVPFGEYVPLRERFPWLQAFTPYDRTAGDYSCTPGESWTRFELPVPGRGTFRFGVLICYEDTDPYLARQYNPWAGRGPNVDFLVNTSNDGWFDGSEQHEQHLAISRFRAVEARRSVVRAVNMGISAVIDPDGRVVALPGDSWARSKKTTGVVTAVVPVDDRGSVYAAAGDWVPGLCWALVVVGVTIGRRRRAG
jgi:apolipoprotein N-acyltransferase